jgi:hypothetical protein
MECVSISSKGHKSTKASLARGASAIALSDTLKSMMAESQDTMAKRDENKRPEKEASAASTSTSPNKP